jgi:hypothetical protein
MSIGGLLAILDKRYRRRKEVRKREQAQKEALKTAQAGA